MQQQRWILVQAKPWLAALVALALGQERLLAAPEDRVPGEWLVVRTPITSESVTRLKNATHRAIEGRGARKIIYHFQFSGASEVGPCLDFANFLLRDIKGRAETYAYVDRPLLGHAVLPALSCNYLWLGPDAAIGQATTPTQDAADKALQLKYIEVAEARGKPVALVLKMLYPELVVYQIDTPEGKKFRLDREQVQRLGLDPQFALGANEIHLDPKPVLREREPGLYKPSDPRTQAFGLWGRVVASPQQVVELLGLPGSLVQGNPLMNLDQPPRAARIVIKNEITRGSVESIRRQIKRAVERDRVQVIIFELNAWGGPNSVRIADDLAKEIADLKERGILTIAYIPTAARGAATYIAFGCSRIVMGPRAELGDCQALLFDRSGRPLPERDVSVYRESLKNLAERQGYSPVLAEGLLNPAMEIVKVRSRPDPAQPASQPATSFLERAKAEKEAKNWEIVGVVKAKDRLLAFDTDKALECNIAWERVDPPTLENVAQLEGIEPRNLVNSRDSFLDELAAFLAHPVTTVFLVIVFFTCLILEFKAPGIGVPGVIAAISIVLVIWANSWLAGEINSLAILLLLLGAILLAVELFILPGFGVCGISGILLVLLGLSLVAVQRWPQTPGEYLDLGRNLSIFAAGLLVSIVAAFVLARYLPNVPYANRLMLPPPEDESSAAGASLPPAQSPALLGAVGVAVTPLRPAGKARFGDQFIDVVAEGAFVEPGTRVQVVEIDGVRVVVKAI
jgi:membrane-bound ClpP family serine protease